MGETDMETKFAPAERDNFEKIIESNLNLSGIVYMKDILKSFSMIVFVLNEKRQIVFVNDVLLVKLGVEQEELLLGGRTGEVFGCINSNNEPGGCGTSEACRYCGATNVILKCQQSNKKEVEETVIVVKNGEYTKQLDLEITITPFYHDDVRYFVVSLADITMKKNKQAMERIFYHDIINIAGSLSGILNLMPDLQDAEKDEFLTIAGNLSTQIIDEIKAQREMQQAEDGELAVDFKPILIDNFLRQIANHIQYHEVAKGKTISYTSSNGDVFIDTDQVLLTRIMVNMLKNSLEAIPFENEVKYGWNLTESGIRIWVHNNGVIPVNIQMQIFQRSFSTKGKGRGLGTYSIKLLGERYLGGKVGFISNNVDGTIFYIDLPLNRKANTI